MRGIHRVLQEGSMRPQPGLRLVRGAVRITASRNEESIRSPSPPEILIVVAQPPLGCGNAAATPEGAVWWQKAALAHRAGLPGTETRALARALRGTRLARLSPPCHPVHRRRRE